MGWISREVAKNAEKAQDICMNLQFEDFVQSFANTRGLLPLVLPSGRSLMPWQEQTGGRNTLVRNYTSREVSRNGNHDESRVYIDSVIPKICPMPREQSKTDI